MQPQSQMPAQPGTVHGHGTLGSALETSLPSVTPSGLQLLSIPPAQLAQGLHQVSGMCTQKGKVPIPDTSPSYSQNDPMQLQLPGSNLDLILRWRQTV